MATSTAAIPDVRAQGVTREDIELLSQNPNTDAFRFNTQEKQILSLWDKEQDLLLQHAILEAQSKHDLRLTQEVSSISDGDLEKQIKIAEQAVLNARARYTIQQDIVTQTLSTDPILKAIHAPDAPLAARLAPLIRERDILSMLHSTLASQLQETHSDLADREREVIEANDTNRALASRMLALAEDAGSELRAEDVADATMRAKLVKLTSQTEDAQREWRIWKNVVAGIVAGSGVDWAKNEEFLEVVLDAEEEDG